MAEADVKFGIGAEDAGFSAAMEAAAEQAKLAAETIKSSFENVSGTFEKLTGLFAKFTAILAGGHLFKEVIEGSVEWTEGSKKLANALGISLERASDYQVALRRLGIDNDVLVTATDKLSKQIFTNGAAFQKLGVATEEGVGKFRPMGDILDDVLGKLKAITDPIARNIAGQQAFGKGWGEIRPLLKLTADAMEQATARAKELGLEVGEAQEQNVKKYKSALRDVQLVATSLSNALGRELLPALTQIGTAFGGEGGNAAKIFAESLRVVAYGAGIVSIEFQKMGQWIGAVAASIAAIGPGWSKADDAIKASFDSTIKDLNAKADGLWEKLHKPLPAPEIDDTEKKGGPFSPKDNAPSQMGAWEKELAQQKAAYAAQEMAAGTFRDFTKAQELLFWQQKVGISKAGTADDNAVRKDVANLQYAIAKQGFDNELAALKEQESKYKNNLDAKLAIAKEYAAKIKASSADGDERAANAAAAHVLELEREIDEQRLQSAEAFAKQRAALEMFGIDAQERSADLSLALEDETNQQRLSQEASFENQRFAIRMAELNREKSLLGDGTNPENAAKYQQNAAAIEAAATSHSAKMQEIANRTVLDQQKVWKSLTDRITQGFATAFSGFLKGSMTIGQTVRSMFASIGSAIADTLAQMAAKNIATMLMQAAVGKTIKMKEIAGDAATAAGGAFSATAAIPYVGPFLAPLAAAAAFASVMAFGSSISAEGGYDIPAGVNPVVQTHQREMILPAKYADTIRNMGDSGGGGGDTHHHWNVSTMDAASFRKFAMNNKGTIFDAGHAHARSTGRVAPGH